MSLKIGRSGMLYSIPSNYIRQWCYCPRIVYYMEFTSFRPEYPIWVKQGYLYHENEARLWNRRNLSRFGLETGKIRLNYSLSSKKYGIHGVSDMIIESNNKVFPVEFKLDKSLKKKGGILQLVSYGIMAGEIFSKECSEGFFLEGKKSLYKICFSDDNKKEVLRILKDIRIMINNGVKPDSSASINKCTNCEYINHCNDR